MSSHPLAGLSALAATSVFAHALVTASDTSASARAEFARARQVAESKSLAPAPHVRAFDVRAHDRLAFDVDADGATWVRGRTYKARFDADGATYSPFLGSTAPKTYPVTLSLTDAGSGIALEPASGARRDGDRIVIERGVVDEVYEVSLDGIEQTFVVGERPAARALRFTVAIATELTARETAAGFEFANELGGVRYGRAFARNDDGTRIALPTRIAAGGIEIDVPETVLATARFPLTIDPVISTFVLNGQPLADDYRADVAYEGSTGHYLVAHEETFSTTDHDVYVLLLDANGVAFNGGYVDFTAENWVGPKCASLYTASQFLVAASATGVPGSLLGVVRGRTIGAGDAVFGAKFNISATDQSGSKVAVDVGGDPYAGLAYYCVVWQRNETSTNSDIHARLVASDGTLVGGSTLLIDNSASTLDAAPSVSKSNGQNGATAAWGIAWHRAGDIRAARISYGGATIDPSFAVTSAGGIDAWASVSSPRSDGSYMIAWRHDFTSDEDVYAALISGPTVLDTENVTALDTPGTILEDQIDVSIDSDGEQFALVYAQSFQGSGFDYDTWITSLHTVSNQIGVSEGHLVLDLSTDQDLRPEIASVWGGGGSSTRYLAAWDETAGGVDHDVRGAFYDGLVGGPVTKFCPGDGTGASCPCGNSGSLGRGCANSFNAAGASLNGDGVARTGADSLQLQASGVPANVTCTFFQGTTGSTSGTVFGDGLRCATGTVIRLRTKFATPSGTASYPVGAENDVHVAGLVPAAGGTRYYQVTYRNSAPFCTSATFNTTNGTKVVWIP